MKTEKTLNARNYSIAAHDSIAQKRKYSGEPYWTHTNHVAGIVENCPNADENMICAAHLHDVLEDVFPKNPNVNRARIREVFGADVLGMVEALTEEFSKERYPHLNRKARKEREAERLGRASDRVKTIKLADLLSNTGDIVQADPVFARTYLAEKAHLLPFLEGGDAGLMERAKAQINDGLLTIMGASAA